MSIKKVPSARPDFDSNFQNFTQLMLGRELPPVEAGPEPF